MAMVFINSFMK